MNIDKNRETDIDRSRETGIDEKMEQEELWEKT